MVKKGCLGKGAKKQNGLCCLQIAVNNYSYRGRGDTDIQLCVFQAVLSSVVGFNEIPKTKLLKYKLKVEKVRGSI